MGFGEERRAPEVNVLSVKPVDPARERRVRLARRLLVVAVLAVVGVLAAGPGWDAAQDWLDDDAGEPVRAVDTGAQP